MKDKSLNIVKADFGKRNAPASIFQPSDYGLVLSVEALKRDWGKVGAINRLIEVIKRLEEDDDLAKWALSHRRVEL